MGIFDKLKGDHQNHYDEVTGAELHKASLSHEVLAGAASFAAAHKVEEEYEKRSGKKIPHKELLDLLAAGAGAFIDREVETKGRDLVDREKFKHEAKKHAEQLREKQMRELESEGLVSRD